MRLSNEVERKIVVMSRRTDPILADLKLSLALSSAFGFRADKDSEDGTPNISWGHLRLPWVTGDIRLSQVHKGRLGL